MKAIHSNSVRFLKLHLHNYGIFKGSHDFVFDSQRTIIIGEGGTGKTSIINALKYLGPTPGVKPHFGDESGDMSAEVITSGNRDLIKRFRHIVFLDHESTQVLARKQEDMFADVLDDQQKEMIRVEVRNIFNTLVPQRVWKAENYKDLNPQIMSHGERVCLSYAYVFGFRKALNLDLPVVFDSPYEVLDLALKHEVRVFLKKQACQQILLGSGNELREEGKSHYRLNHEK